MRSIFFGSVVAVVSVLLAFELHAQRPGLPSVPSIPKPSPSPVKPKDEPRAETNASKTAVSAGEYPKHFFFTTAAKATGKVLKAKDLVACISGDNANPSNAGAFKKVVPTVGGQKGRVIDAGTCDVVVLVIKDAEGEKNLERDNAGFAVYKIVGDDLELMFKPEAGQHVAVGKMDLASSQELKKIDVRACGHPELRNAFRPNPDTWKTWVNEYADGERIPRMTVDNYPLKYSCDVWVMTMPIYDAFVKKFGNKHPVFDVNTTDPVLRRKK